MKKFLSILFFLCSLAAFATHERAGEITYRHLGGNTYSITVTTYTKGTSSQADRCTQVIYFGDGDSAVVCRSNYEPGDPSSDPWGASGCSGNPNCSFHHMGQWSIGNPTLQSLNIKKNEYSVVHTYPGPNTYIISMTDPNRNDGIVNVDDQSQFSIQDTLKILTAPGMPTYNNSVYLTNPPIDKACIGVIFIHNPGAVDPDGDSLAYKLGVCFQAPGQPVNQYFIPSGVTVDPYTGDLTWNTPQILPFPPYALPYEYNFAMDIQEWKLNVANGKRYLIGTVRRDMQVRVYDCNNDPPIISAVDDTCIVAGTSLTLTVTATDQGSNDIVTFGATGDPFNTSPPASFSSNVPPAQMNIATGIFTWSPTCNQVRLNPYLVTFKALDDGAPDSPAVPLSDYETFFIRVIAPAPKNITAVPQCTNMLLAWDPVTCNPTGNPLYKYKIYRKLGCDTLKPQYCETGMPTSWGYTQIALLSNTTTTYSDNNGLVHGNMYSYRVVAYYKDGSESYVSDPFCNKLVRDVPIITNVDVKSTGTGGSIDVKWLKPVADPANYDTTQAFNQGPYKFELLGAAGNTNPVPPAIATFTSSYFATLNTVSYLDSPVNTSATPFTYRIDFYSDTNHCPTQNASSVFLTCNPGDNKLQISWNEQVPWTNYQYDVYRYNKVATVWDSIGTTASQTFTDSGLANGVQYCYKVKSIGAYPDTSLPHPLINWSQELCCSPQDMTPPCANELAVDSSCDLSQNILTWTNPNNSCSDDALYYIIYHSDSTDADFYVVDTIFDINITSFLDDSLNSIAGCYAVTSVDSFGNESAFSNLVCIDNCPYYELPNVFTPNGDGTNDHFTPLHPYKYVHSIDIRIFNRWGVEVFRTFDPEIMWNGFSVQSNLLCSDGVYYYVCIVYDIRLEGILPHVLTGNIHLLSK